MSNIVFKRALRRGDIAVACIDFDINIHKIVHAAGIMPVIDDPALLQSENLRGFFRPESFKQIKRTARIVHQTGKPEIINHIMQKDGFQIYRQVRMVKCCHLERVLIFIKDYAPPDKIRQVESG